jgi:hypothetical protein
MLSNRSVTADLPGSSVFASCGEVIGRFLRESSRKRKKFDQLLHVVKIITRLAHL